MSLLGVGFFYFLTYILFITCIDPRLPIQISIYRSSAFYLFCIRVEWLSTFFDFWIPSHFCRSGIGIFLEVHFQHTGNFGRARQSFNLEKITGTLKQKPSLYILEQSQKIKLEIKICLILFFIFQKRATLLMICTRENYFFLNLSSDFAFNS